MTRWQNWFPKLLLGLLLATDVSALAPTAEQAELGAKAAELERLREEIQAVSVGLDSARGEHDELRVELQAAEQEIGKLNWDLAQREAELHKQSWQLAELIKTKQIQQADLAKERRALAGQVRAAYAIGRQEYLKILLNQQDPAAIGRSLVYYEYFNRDRIRRIDDLAERVQQLNALEKTIARQLASLEQLRGVQVEERRILEEKRQQRATILAQLNTEIDIQGQELNRLQGDERQLEQLLAALQRALTNIPAESKIPFAALKGKLPWPTQGAMLARFGSPRADGVLRWQGVLIGAAEGQRVQAIAGGRVVFADWLRGFGLLMIIDHREGYMSLYGHNRNLYKKTGDAVAAGDPITEVGDSGGRDRYGLYFEIRHEGEPGDPALWCSGDK